MLVFKSKKGNEADQQQRPRRGDHYFSVGRENPRSVAMFQLIDVVMRRINESIFEIIITIDNHRKT